MSATTKERATSCYFLELTCARVDVATTRRLRRRVENSIEKEPKARRVRCDDTAMYVELIDGRTLTAPLDWFPRLLHASPDQRRRCELSDQGRELSWEFGVRVSVSGLLAGRGRETVIGPASRLSSLTASALELMPVPLRSVADCHDALAACNRQDAPLAWARAQTNLGYALFSLHEGPPTPIPRRSLRRSRLIAPRLRSARASAHHSTGQGFSALSASRSRCLADTRMIPP
jgi:Protein of unknown function (DUF2442)